MHVRPASVVQLTTNVPRLSGGRKTPRDGTPVLEKSSTNSERRSDVRSAKVARGVEQTVRRGGRNGGGKAFRRGERPSEWNALEIRPKVEGLKEEIPMKAGPSLIDGMAKHLTGVATVMVKRGKARLFWEGNPIVYGGAVDHVDSGSDLSPGDPVLLADHTSRAFGWGVYNPNSMYRVRVMQLEADVRREPEDCFLNPDSLLRHRLSRAVQLRRSLDLPSPSTNVYRLLNSEGDRMSGLVVDVIGGSAVVLPSAAWLAGRENLIRQLLLQQEDVQCVLWRPNLAMWNAEGVPAPSGDPTGEVGDTSEPAVLGPQGDNGLGTPVGCTAVEALEAGVRYRADVERGQKTGFYADQRENRALVRRLSRGKRVLDLCCYSGGFAINAAIGGATHVTGVDESASAIALAIANRSLNGLPEDTCEFQQAEISSFMAAAAKQELQYDLVILDPPKLAPSAKVLAQALRKYRSLNVAAMKLVAPGGLLMTCSCSGAVAQSGQFVRVLQEAAAIAGRSLSLLRVAGPGPDHPLDPGYPEGAYLSNVLVLVA